MSAAGLRQHRGRLLVVVLIAGLVVALSVAEPVQEAIGRGLDAAKEIVLRHEVLGVGLFALLSTISAIAFFFSTAILVPVAVYAWGKPATMSILWASWMVGAAASYAIGRNPVRRLAKWLISEQQVARYERRIAADASFGLVFLFQLAVPSEIPGYVLGSLRYPFWRYLAARALAEVPFAIGTVYLGDTFVRRQYLPLVAMAVAGLIFSALALYLLHRRIDR
jgi:uncharacterized membrane protein YdjX (TVP38/TMEM64 family)